MFTLIASFVILFSLLFLGPVFYYLPKVIMSAVIIVAAYGLLEFEDIVFVWKMKGWKDMAVMLVTFVITLSISVEVGIMAGIAISILLLVKNITKLHLSVYGQIPGTSKFKDVEKYPEAKKIPDILIVGVHDALYFSNVQKAKDLIARIEKLGSHVIHPGADHIESSLKAVIFVTKNIPDLDVSAVQIIHEMKENYEHRKIFFCFVGLTDRYKEWFKEAGIFHRVTVEECVFNSIQEAVSYVQELEYIKSPTVNKFEEMESAESALIMRGTSTKDQFQSNIKKRLRLPGKYFREIRDQEIHTPRRASLSKQELPSIGTEDVKLVEIELDEEIKEDPPV